MNSREKERVTSSPRKFSFIKIAAVLFCTGVLFLGSAIKANAAGYQYYVPITVTSNISIASGTQSNFPMLVSSTLSQWIYPGGHISNVTTTSAGILEPADLVFATSTANCGTQNLNFETEGYSSSTGALVDWVNIPSLSAGAIIYACYGNSSVTTDQSHPSSTWNANYASVYHLSVPTSTLNTKDSTLNANNAGNVGGTATATGEIDGAGLFNGSSQYLTPGTGPIQFQTTNTFSGSAWIKTTNTSEESIISDWVPLVTGGWEFGISEGGATPNAIAMAFESASIGAALSISGSTNIVDGNFHYVAFTYDGSDNANGIKLYVDGKAESINVIYNTNPGSLGNTNPEIGARDYSPAPTYFNGTIGEVCITSSTLSPSWILTEYNNQSLPSAFYTIGSEGSFFGALSAGVINLTSVTPTTLNLSASSAARGTSPYYYQWYRSTTSGFTPGSGTILSGQTSLTLNDTGLTPSTTYYYVLGVTDSVSSTAYSSQFSATTNAFATGFTLSGPSSGYVNATSTNFTITPNGQYTGTITPNSTGLGTFSPSSLTWASSTAAQTFTYNPTSGNDSPFTINASSSPTLINSSGGVSYATPWTQAFYDSFNRANGSIGNGWVGATSTASISADTLYVNSGASNPWVNDLVLRPMGEVSANQLVAATYLAGDTNPFYLSLRTQTPGNQYLSGIDTPSNCGSGTYCVHSFSVTSDALTSLGIVNFSSYNSADSYQFSASVSGTSPTTLTITVTDLNSGTIVATQTVTDSTSGLQQNGQVGLFFSGSGYIDDFTDYTQSTTTIPATSYTMTGPSSTYVGQTSGIFSITPNGHYTGTITPSDGGVGGIFSPSSLTFASSSNAQTFTYTATSTGSITISAISNPAIINPVSLPIAVTNGPFAVNNSDLFWSHDNVYVNGPSYALMMVPGAYLKTDFTGTSIILNVNLSVFVSASVAAANYPLIRYQVDGGSWIQYQLTSTTTAVTASGFSSGTHTFRFEYVANTEQTDNWNTPVNPLEITGVSLDNGAVLQMPAVFSNTLRVDGDSITQGIRSYAAVSSPAGNRSYLDYAYLLAQSLNMELTQLGYGAQGYSVEGSGNIPTYPSAMDYYYNGVPRLSGGVLPSAPTYWMIVQGENDGSNSIGSTVQTVIGKARTEAGANCQIFIVVPFSGVESANITAGYNAYVAANPSDTKVHLINLGSISYTTTDGEHPDAVGHQVIAAAILAQLLPATTVSPASGVASSSAILHGTLTSTGMPTSTIEGFYYGTSASYGFVASSIGSFVSGTFALPITGLLPNTTYHYQAFATNQSGIATSSDQTFTTFSNDASLSNFTVNSGTLNPTFASSTTSYTDSVANSVTSMTITPTATQGASSTITVSVNSGTPVSVASGATSTALSLSVGSNTISILVTAPDGVTTSTYTLAVTRAVATYTLSYSAGANGTITGSSTQTVAYGSNGTAVTAVPSTGYHFVDWSDASTTNPRTDSDVMGNASVTAIFATTNVLTITSFSLSATSTSLTVPITSFTTGETVAGYFLNESSTTPSSTTLGWTSTVPVSYAFQQAGSSRILYAWVKDGSGNVSSPASATVSFPYYAMPSGNSVQTLVSSGIVTSTASSVASTTAITFNDPVQVSIGASTVSIPSGTTMTTASSSDFTTIVAITTVATDNLPSNSDVLGTVQYGLASSSISLSQLVTITIPVDPSYDGQTLPVYQSENGGVSWTQITTCLITNGICSFTTSNLSSFAVVAPTVIPPSATPGVVVATGGGGSAYTIYIDNGVATTTTPSVTLSLYGTGAYTMELSNTSSFANSTWIPYVNSIPWTLATSTGKQTVFVQYRVVSGSIVGSAQASIDLAVPSTSTMFSASGMSIAQIENFLASLEAQLKTLESQASLTASFTFTRNLSLWSTGNDVEQLQQFLISQNSGTAARKLSAHGATKTFGMLTFNALVEFQKSFAITPASGYFGAITRKYVTSL